MTAADQLADDARALARFPVDVAQAVVDGVAAAVRPRLAADTGGDNRLSGVPTARLAVVTSVIEGHAYTEAFAAAGPKRARGVWDWLNAGTRPHGGHPGTRAKRTFDDPVDAVVPVLLDDVDGMFRLVID